ncbi:hypothetical protein AAZX31_05G201600 [Glycine max]
MGSTKVESYFVFMSYDPEYGRLQADRTKRGVHELDLYLDRKHDELLASTLEPGSYKKTSSLVIVDAFAVEITEDQVIYIYIYIYIYMVLLFSFLFLFLIMFTHVAASISHVCLLCLNILFSNRPMCSDLQKE